MVRHERTTEAVRAAVEATPTSIRALARAAGVPHVSLLKIRDGEMGASAELGRAVAEALESWADGLGGRADAICGALERDSKAREASDG